jgi:hypothetical protein
MARFDKSALKLQGLAKNDFSREPITLHQDLKGPKGNWGLLGMKTEHMAPQNS